jgi:hypothetical protein
MSVGERRRWEGFESRPLGPRRCGSHNVSPVQGSFSRLNPSRPSGALSNPHPLLEARGVSSDSAARLRRKFSAAPSVPVRDDRSGQCGDRAIDWFAYGLAIPELRAWPVQRFPYVAFYVVTDEEIDVWRILHTRRDPPATLEPPET